jgi:PAS domain S-box-containing protein
MSLSELSPSSLARRMAAWLLAAFVLVAAGLLAVSARIGQSALQREHEAASLRMAALFEAGLRNSMMARDLPSLQQLVDRLGGLPGLDAASLVHPAGQVRFASSSARVGADESASLRGLCLSAGCGEPSTAQLQWGGAAGRSTLRVVYPVRNETRCAGCHGQPAQQPVNGVLLLDFAPLASERMTLQHAGTRLLPAALAALGLLALFVGWVFRREVLRPLAGLLAPVARFGTGDLGARTVPTGAREIRQLGSAFDRMAEQVQSQVATLSAHGRFLQSLLDTAPNPMLLVGDDHRIAMANEAYARLVGLDRADVIGRTCYATSRGRNEPCERTLVTCPQAECKVGSPPLRTVMAFTRGDGKTVDVEIDAAALRGPNGERQVLQVIHCLDEQVRFSQEQRLSAIGLLANGVAHEIHNPLASIRLALQSSLRGLQDGSIERAELVEYLGLVDAEIDRCVNITQRLLRMSQPSVELAQPVAVREAVNDVLGLLADEARRAGVACEVKWNGIAEHARVLGDEGELRQILLNLVQNAVHAMPRGGRLTLTVQAGEPGTCSLRIAVCDTGCGIAAADLPLIFMPFFSRRADGQRGTGLGLAICKTLAERRGGHLSVRTTLGEGSCFELVLPDADSQLQVTGEAA